MPPAMIDSLVTVLSVLWLQTHEVQVLALFGFSQIMVHTEQDNLGGCLDTTACSQTWLVFLWYIALQSVFHSMESLLRQHTDFPQVQKT